MQFLPHPFKPLSSFLSYAVGLEKIEIKPEWAGVVAPVARVDRKAAA